MRRCGQAKISNNLIYYCECDEVVKCELKSGKELYPHRPDLYSIKMYECPICHNRVGTHKGTTIPLGCIPTPEMKNARRLVHALIDPLWKSGKVKRKELYERISKELGYPYHTAKTVSMDELREVYKIGQKIWKEI